MKKARATVTIAARMDPTALAQHPFAALTFIAAPALLTNASSVLALSTINRMLRARDRMQDLYAQSEAGGQSAEESKRLLTLTERAEKQARLLLRALHSIYVALGTFAGSTLVALVGAGVDAPPGTFWLHMLAGLGLLLGFGGVGGLVVGCVSLSQATRISLVNIREEAALIRQRQAQRAATKPINSTDPVRPVSPASSAGEP